MTKSTLEELIREEVKNVKLGSRTISRSSQAAAAKQRAKDISSGASLGDITSKERGILKDVEEILTKIAEKDDLNKYRNKLESILKSMMAKSSSQGNRN